MSHGCHNRPPMQDTLRVQLGWRVSDQGFRTPWDHHIEHSMTRDCQYTLGAPDDPGCEGCRHQKKTPALVAPGCNP